MSGHQLLTAALIFTLCADSGAAADLGEIVRRGAAALKSDWAAHEDYAFIEKDEVLKNGQWTGRTFRVVFIEGSDYYIPLDSDPAQVRAEGARRMAETSEQRHERIAKYQKSRDANDALVRDFPDAFSFGLTGEETIGGRRTYVMAATPRKRNGSLSVAAKVLSGMQGTIWVDEETFHVVRVKCDVVNSVPVYGILAKVLPGTHVEFAMNPVTENVWLVSEIRMTLRISKVFFFRSTQETRSTFTDYRPNSEVLSELLQPPPSA